MLISSIALLAFMFFVSFGVWPQAVLGISFLAGILVTLQYLLFGAHRIVLAIRWVFKRLGAVFARLFSRSEEVELAEKEGGGDSQQSTADAAKANVGDEGKEDEKKV